MNIKTLLATACGVAFALSSVAQEANPVANPDAVVTLGNARFTVLTPEMIRLEYSEKKQFEDRASFVVINRYFADVPQFTVDSTGNEVVIKTDALELRYKKGTPFYNDDRCNPNLSITMQLNGESIQWYPGKVDPYNLKGTTRTLDQAEGDVRDWLEDGLVSRSGWASSISVPTRLSSPFTASVISAESSAGMGCWFSFLSCSSARSCHHSYALRRRRIFAFGGNASSQKFSHIPRSRFTPSRNPRAPSMCASATAV